MPLISYSLKMEDGIAINITLIYYFRVLLITLYIPFIYYSTRGAGVTNQR